MPLRLRAQSVVDRTSRSPFFSGLVPGSGRPNLRAKLGQLHVEPGRPDLPAGGLRPRLGQQTRESLSRPRPVASGDLSPAAGTQLRGELAASHCGSQGW